MATLWKKGRGRLGVFDPLLGNWLAQSDSPRGPVRISRHFNIILDAKYVELQVDWIFSGYTYSERSLFGVDQDQQLKFWSFTSDGKRSEGVVADATDLHPQALGFEAMMPDGLARQVYWPDDESGFHWVVESKNRRGWNRFVAHHYHAIQEEP